jgi:hypothetical protein
MDDKFQKEQIIDQYFSNMELINIEKNLDVNQIKNDLRNALHEEPAINVKYTNKDMLLEDGKSKKRIEEIESITVFYTYFTAISDKPALGSKTFILK